MIARDVLDLSTQRSLVEHGRPLAISLGDLPRRSVVVRLVEGKHCTVVHRGRSHPRVLSN